jgi:hypothetical protein
VTHRNYGGSSRANATPPPPPTGDPLLVASLNITAAQVLALHTTPLTIVSAPDAAHAAVPIAYYTRIHFATTAYSGSGRLHIYITSQDFQFSQIIADATLFSNGDDTDEFGCVDSVLNQPGTPCGIYGQPITLQLDAAQTGGDSPITVTLFYALAPTP